MDSNLRFILLGTGAQAREYLKVLKHLNLLDRCVVWGRNPAKLQELSNDYSVECSSDFNTLYRGSGDLLINALASGVMFEFTMKAINCGFKKLLLEKPVGLYQSELNKLQKIQGIDIGVALNRRYFTSILKAKDIIFSNRFRPISCFFNFTELIHLVEQGNYSAEEKSRWGIVNSIHVFDTVRFLVGDIQWKYNEVLRKDGIAWHPHGNSWLCSGVSGQISVVGMADWCAPGRWSIEILSANRSLKLCPMEVLQFMDRGSFSWQEMGTDLLPKDLKPGLHPMVKDFQLSAPNRSASWTTLDDYKKSFDSMNEVLKYRDF